MSILSMAENYVKGSYRNEAYSRTHLEQEFCTDLNDETPIRIQAQKCHKFPETVFINKNTIRR